MKGRTLFLREHHSLTLRGLGKLAWVLSNTDPQDSASRVLEETKSLYHKSLTLRAGATGTTSLDESVNHHNLVEVVAVLGVSNESNLHSHSAWVRKEMIAGDIDWDDWQSQEMLKVIGRSIVGCILDERQERLRDMRQGVGFDCRLWDGSLERLTDWSDL